jgi:hypothetical protein
MRIFWPVYWLDMNLIDMVWKGIKDGIIKKHLDYHICYSGLILLWKVSTENHMLMPSMCQVKRQAGVTHEMCVVRRFTSHQCQQNRQQDCTVVYIDHQIAHP